MSLASSFPGNRRTDSATTWSLEGAGCVGDRQGAIFVSALLLLAATILAFGPVPARAQRVVRVGLLSDESPSASSGRLPARTLSKALQDLGWEEGKKLIFERRYAAGKNAVLPGLAAELVHLKVDVIVAIGTPAARAAKNATATIPVVFARVGDPVGSGLVQSLARPGANLTGMSVVTVDLGPKRLQLLKDLLPRLDQVGVLWDPSFRVAAPELARIEEGARSLGVEIHRVEVRRPEEFEDAMAALKRHDVDGIVLMPSLLFFDHRQRLAELATSARLPIMSYRREYVDAGGFISYGAHFADMYRRAARFVDKILRGARPGDLPVEEPTTLELVVNAKAAAALGLSIPQSIAVRADEVIRE